jgi:hypothetical protein
MVFQVLTGMVFRVLTGMVFRVLTGMVFRVLTGMVFQSINLPSPQLSETVSYTAMFFSL